jgi:hypothetical protein
LGVTTAQRAAGLNQAGIATSPALARVQLPARVPDAQRTPPRKEAAPHTAPRDLSGGHSPLAAGSPVHAAAVAVEHLTNKPGKRNNSAPADQETIRDRTVGDGAKYLDVSYEQGDAHALGDFRDGRYETFDGTEDFVEGFEA